MAIMKKEGGQEVAAVRSPGKYYVRLVSGHYLEGVSSEYFDRATREGFTCDHPPIVPISQKGGATFYYPWSSILWFAPASNPEAKREFEQRDLGPRELDELKQLVDERMSQYGHSDTGEDDEPFYVHRLRLLCKLSDTFGEMDYNSLISSHLNSSTSQSYAEAALRYLLATSLVRKAHVKHTIEGLQPVLKDVVRLTELGRFVQWLYAATSRPEALDLTKHHHQHLIGVLEASSKDFNFNESMTGKRFDSTHMHIMAGGSCFGSIDTHELLKSLGMIIPGEIETLSELGHKMIDTSPTKDSVYI